MARFNRRVAGGLAGLAALQVSAYLTYRFVSGRRAQPPSKAFAYESAAGKSVSDLVLEAADGRALPLSEQLGRPVILHFWATWCAPCRAELPTLLAAFENGTEGKAPRLLLVSVDENWDTIRHYFGGALPKPVVRDPHSRGRRHLGVTTLPETLCYAPTVRRWRVSVAPGIGKAPRPAPAWRRLSASAEARIERRLGG